MDIRQFRSELGEAFTKAGFEKKKKSNGNKATVWALPGREVDRSFWEQATRRPWGFRLDGFLTVDVPSFRSWLVTRFPANQHGIVWSSLFGRHIANHREMFFAVETGSQPPYQEWVSLIRRRLAVLPDTIEDLASAVRHKAQGLDLVWDDHSSPKAWAYFDEWRRGNEPCAPPPYYLPTGRIVDAAANDLS